MQQQIWHWLYNHGVSAVIIYGIMSLCCCTDCDYNYAVCIRFFGNGSRADSHRYSTYTGRICPYHFLFDPKCFLCRSLVEYGDTVLALLPADGYFSFGFSGDMVVLHDFPWKNGPLKQAFWRTIIKNQLMHNNHSFPRYTLYLRWLHPFAQMATPSGNKGVLTSKLHK